MLVDNHGRTVDYVRIALIDKCNLRCTYCMPEQGLQWKKNNELLDTTEIKRVLGILSQLGFKKVRFTGGEPFLRNDFTELLKYCREENLFENIHITTNGSLLTPHLSLIKDLNINGVNLSLDTLQSDRFFQITKRNQFDKVYAALEELIASSIATKLNVVVMEGVNTDEIIDFCELTKHYPIAVRFIEEMPFNGGNGIVKTWTQRQIERHIREHYGEDLSAATIQPTDTASKLHIKDYVGSIGIIAAFTRNFCGTCNRLRITPTGEIKTCLYDRGVFSIREMLRKNYSDLEVKEQIIHAIQHRHADGHSAELSRYPIDESMATIGG